MRSSVGILLLVGSTSAFAEAPVTANTTMAAETAVTKPVDIEKPASASDVAADPRPGQESGRLDEVDGGDGALRYVGRGLLWIPRLPLELVVQPIRGGLYVQDKYHAAEVVSSWFTTEDKKIAIFPTALVETGFGFNVGARAQFKDVFGAGERIGLRAGTGGEFKTIAEAKFSLGDKESNPVFGGVRARYEKRNRDRFYGYGNGDVVEPTGILIDPTTSDDAFGTVYQLTTSRIAPFVTARMGDLALTARTNLIRDRVSSAEMTADGNLIRERPIASFYDTATLPGFAERDSMYSELEVAWDTRRAANEFDPRGMRGTGGLVSVFGGLHDNLDDDLKFFRGGVDLQRYIPITRGPRVIELRAYAEAVSGARDEIPFLELPTLGGLQRLRGYDRNRFRDRVAAVAQAGYLFSLSRALAGSIFVDVGRVYSGVDELTWRDQRVGFGGAIELYNTKNMVLRSEIAGSVDGSMYIYISLDPAFDSRARTERR